jgi:hypothetical protein
METLGMTRFIGHDHSTLVPIDMSKTPTIKERYLHTRISKRESMQVGGKIVRTIHIYVHSFVLRNIYKVQSYGSVIKFDQVSNKI